MLYLEDETGRLVSEAPSQVGPLMQQPDIIAVSCLHGSLTNARTTNAHGTPACGILVLRRRLPPTSLAFSRMQQYRESVVYRGQSGHDVQKRTYLLGRFPRMQNPEGYPIIPFYGLARE